MDSVNTGLFEMTRDRNINTVKCFQEWLYSHLGYVDYLNSFLGFPPKAQGSCLSLVPVYPSLVAEKLDHITSFCSCIVDSCLCTSLNDMPID